MSILRAHCVALCSLVLGCGEDQTSLFVLEAFVADGPGGLLASPGFGPENRLILATTEPPGRVGTVDRASGTPVDAAFDAFPTPHPPVALDRRIFLVTPVGRLAGYELDGTSRGLFPNEPLGRTTPPLLAPGPSLRVATTGGRLLGLDGGGALTLDVSLSGRAAVGALVVPNGTVVTTDTGAVLFFAEDGSLSRQDMLTPPVSAPAQLSGQVGVIAADGFQIFDLQGNRVASADAGGASGVVGRDGVFLVWSPDGRLRGISASGEATFNLSVPGLSNAGPVALSGGRFGLVADDGTARAIVPDGTVGAERAAVRLPTGPLVVDDTTDRVFYPSGAAVVGLDFAVPL
ncbi:MAG: hypothetical protein AAFU79_25310 [Myxococcota bacterium]